MDEFCIGDRVEFIYEHALNDGRLCPGSIGTVVAIRTNSMLTIGVEWDKEMGGHGLNKKCKFGHGWWTSKDHIALYSESVFEPASDDEIMQLLERTEM